MQLPLPAVRLSPLGKSSAHQAQHSIASWIVAAGLPLVLGYSRWTVSEREAAADDHSKSRPASVRIVHPPEAGFFGKRLSRSRELSGGVRIKSHVDVQDAAIIEAGARVARMMASLPPSIRHHLLAAGAEVRVLGENQRITDMPDLAHYRGKVWEKSTGKTLDQRARGLAGVTAVVAEENLLALPSDRHRDHRDICTHEFAHVIHR
eukprot:SAG31_NODE_14077_length_828_cov_1.240055_1_plen_205_part_10